MELISLVNPLLIYIDIDKINESLYYQLLYYYIL